MPCNAVARADAKVSNRALAKLLTPQVVQQSLTPWLKQRVNAEPTVTLTGTGVVFYCAQFSIRVDGANVTLTGGAYSEAQKIAREITTYLTTVSGLLFQQQVKAVLAKRFAVDSTQTAPSGAVVINVEV